MVISTCSFRQKKFSFCGHDSEHSTVYFKEDVGKKMEHPLDSSHCIPSAPSLIAFEQWSFSLVCQCHHYHHHYLFPYCPIQVFYHNSIQSVVYTCSLIDQYSSRMYVQLRKSVFELKAQLRNASPFRHSIPASNLPIIVLTRLQSIHVPHHYIVKNVVLCGLWKIYLFTLGNIELLAKKYLLDCVF